MNNPNELRVDCFKIIQSCYEFYLFIMNSKLLREIAYVSVRDSNKPMGYQRYLNHKRLKEVGDYIKKPRSTFPNSIIVNFEKTKARFEESPEHNKGILVIKREKNIAWIIDGQHRLFGFDHSEGKEFDLIVSAFIGLDIGDQATVFKIINSTQKGVNPSLIYDLIELTKDADYADERAHEIIKALNSDTDSPWNNLIKMVGKGSGIISQAAILNEIKKLLKDPIFKEYPSGEQIRILKDYFEAIKNLFPEAWGNKKYVLCKTLGVAAILSIMPKILIHCRIKNDFNQKYFQKILSHIKQAKIPTGSGQEVIDFSSRQLGGYGGKQGQKLLAEILEKELPPIRPT